MIRTHTLPCPLPDEQCRALNQESGRIYSATLVQHYRTYRHLHLWLSPMKHNRVLDSFCGPSALLHAHSVDAAQQDFYEACKTAKELKKINPQSRYPYKRKFFHTTTWKHTAIKVEQGRMRLALARGQEPVWVALPDHLAHLPAASFRCSACGYVGHRDNVGSTNILSKKQTGKLAQLLPCTAIRYRIPVRRVMRSPVDTRQVARASENPKPLSRPLARRLTGQEESAGL